MLNGLNILVAEDNALNQKLLSIILNRQRASITQAYTGKEAIDFLQERQFDIILMDLQMPEIDGFETASYIRGTMKNNVPIIALTAGLMDDEHHKCLETGMNACLPKPIDPEILYKHILTIIDNNKKQRS